jgi:lysine 2,3-aminomutase
MSALSRRASSDTNWTDWRWQQSGAARSLDDLLRWFPNLDRESCFQITLNSRWVRFQLTPYLLSLVAEILPGRPNPSDPIWKQYVPTYEVPPVGGSLAEHLRDNWELPEDMINPILQHKYDNRVNFRIQNRCLAYCAYCFEAKRVLDKESTVKSFRNELFQESLEYIRRRSDVHEVVISGGEALTLSNDRMDRVLGAIRSISHVRAIRIQTRAFSHNPFRVDDDFVRLLLKHNVTAMGVHVSHPVEITEQFRQAIDRLAAYGCRVMMLGQIPLLKGINDEAEILEELFMSLYALGIKPYYLLHSMPETLGGERFRTSVRRGVELVAKLKRRISNPAMPEYVIVHSKGKHTVPLEFDGTGEFQYLPKGLIRFKNWRGEWCEYLDGDDD